MPRPMPDTACSRLLPNPLVTVPALLLLALILLVMPAYAGTLQWEELTLPAGGRLLVVGTEKPGWMGLSLYFPAGTAQSPEDPTLALLAPRLFLGARCEGMETEQSLADFLLSRGWTVRSSVDLDGAGVFLAGPSDAYRELLAHLLARLRGPDRFGAEELQTAWVKLEADWEKWSRNPEVSLRSAMARLQYGEHPYRHFLGQERPPDACRPEPAALRRFLREHYQPGAAHILVAGDLIPDEFLAEYLPYFDELEGQSLSSLTHPPLDPGAGRLERGNGKGRSLMIVQFPGVRGGHADSAGLALAAGVLQQFLKMDLVGVGLAASASAYYDIMAPGPRPLEVQVRDFRPGDRKRIEALLARFFDRLRSEQFSRYQVISAKDMVFQRLDAGSREGKGPRGDGPAALIAWSQQLLRQELHYRRWSEGFETRLLGTGKENIAQVAARRLREGTETYGLLLPEEELD